MAINKHKFHLNMRKNFFPCRVAEPWNSCPGRTWNLPLETSQTHLDTLLCHLPQVTLPGQEGWTGCSPEGSGVL